MVYKLIIKPKSQQDIREAMEWYKNQNINLPQKFLAKIDESLVKIQKNPQHYQKRYKEIRIVFTRKFPYGIYYTVENHTVYVQAVLHTKQNSDIAENRIK